MRLERGYRFQQGHLLMWNRSREKQAAIRDLFKMGATLEHWVTQFAPGACERDHTKPGGRRLGASGRGAVRAATAVI
jgi:hypothetical protein